MASKAIGSALVVVAIGCGACAQTADKIGAQYVSPVQFARLSCPQLAEEAQRVSARVAHLTGVQNQKATNDAIATGVAIVIFWPAAFLIGGNDQNSAELSRLKGEFEAIEQASTRKNCGHRFQQSSAFQTATAPPRHQ